MHHQHLIQVLAMAFFASGCVQVDQELARSSQSYALEACADGVDDDIDGLVDCMDPDCASFATCIASGVTSCEAQFLLTENNTNIGQISSLGRFGILPTALAFNRRGDTDSNINAMCYNLRDGFVYGIRVADDHLVRLHRVDPVMPATDVYDASSIEDLGTVINLPNDNWEVGECDDQDRLWVKQAGVSDTYTIAGLSALTVGGATPPTATFTTSGLEGNDMAFDPGTQKFYSVGNALDVNRLYEFTIATATTTSRSITGATSASGSHGGVYVDSDGFVSSYNELTGEVRRIDPVTAEATWIGVASVSGAQSDAFSCPLAPPPLEVCDDEIDNDGDGVVDENDMNMMGNNCIVLVDSDMDGTPNVTDLDDDNDGIPDAFEQGDVDRDGIPGRLDLDSDGDGCLDLREAGHSALDADADGEVDGVAVDFGANGLLDSLEASPDANSLDYDSDGNGGDQPSTNASSADINCAAAIAEQCDDDSDNDNDGMVDCADSDCDDAVVCQPEVCDDEMDNDDDGDIDCDDDECVDAPACVPEICDDNMDNDNDGEMDCDDDECFNDIVCGGEDCSNGLDDDGDAAVDCLDRDCFTNPLCAQVEVCGDGMDNDGNGLTDCDDAVCVDEVSCQQPFETNDGLSLSGGGCAAVTDSSIGKSAMGCMMLCLALLALLRRRQSI